MRIDRTVAVYLLIAGVGHADPTGCDEAGSLFQKGVASSNAGRDEEALRMFGLAQARCPSVPALANVALAEGRLGRLVDAARKLRAVLQLADASDPWLPPNRPQLERALALAETRLGRVAITGGVGGTEVLVDGEAAGFLPLPEKLYVTPGEHAIVYRFPAGGVEKQTATVRAREVVTLAAPVPKVAARRIAGAVGLGASALFLGAAIAAHAVREKAVADWNDDTRCVWSDTTRNRGENCAGERDRIRATEVVMAVGYAVGGGLAVASAVLLALRPRGETKAATRVAFGAGPGELGFACSGTF